MEMLELKEMVRKGEILLGGEIEQRLLTDSLDHEDVNFLKRSLNMKEWIKKQDPKKLFKDNEE